MAKTLVSLIALATLAAAGTAVRADDITIDTAPFTTTLSRADVQAATDQARRSGVPFTSEVDLSSTMPAPKSSLTREQVRAGLLAPQERVVTYNPAA